MNKNELVHNLKNGNLLITFKKVDGTMRKMLCTLQESVLPKRSDPYIVSNRPEGTQVHVWDLEKNAWRSFLLESIKNVKLISEHTHK